MEFFIDIPLIRYLIRQRNMKKAKEELMKMLADLSDNALQYVWRPIAYAYYMTDDHGIDLLTDEDVNRFGLIISAALGSKAEVEYLSHEKGYFYGAKHRREKQG